MKNKDRKAIKNVRFFFVAAIVLLVVISAMYVYKKSSDNPNKTNNAQGDQTVQNEDSQEYKPGENEYKIDVQEKDGNKILTNGKAGISLTVPSDWKPDEAYEINNELKLKVSKVGSKQPLDVPSEIIDGITLEIYKYENKSGLGLEKWMQENNIKDYTKTKFQKMEAFEKDSKVNGQLDENFNYIPIEDSMYKAIFIAKDNMVYEIGCSSFGKKYREYSIQCFDLANSNLKL